MKTLLISFIVFIVLLIGQSVSAQMNERQSLMNFSQVWLNAILKRDSTKLSKILADDFIMITPGKKWSRKAILVAIATAPDEHTSAIIDSVNVRFVSKGVGILTAYLTWISIINGDKKVHRTCYQDVCLKRRARWLDVSSHVLWYDTK